MISYCAGIILDSASVVSPSATTRSSVLDEMMNSHQLSLAERQRYILEKGKKRPSQTPPVRGSPSLLSQSPTSRPPSRPPPLPTQTEEDGNESLNSEDPLAAVPCGSAPLGQQTPQIIAAPSSRKIAIVLSPTPKKNKDEYIIVGGAGERGTKRRAVRLPHHPTAISESAENTATSTPEPQMNRRGRPKGWKPGMAYTDLRPSTKSHASTGGGGPKRRGRPPKPTSPPPREVYRSGKAEFLTFLCEWRGCEAELHNLETLRRHLSVVHLRRAKGCLWSSCTERSGNVGGSLIGKTLEKHVEEEHLVPMAWHVGDGPSHKGDGVHLQLRSLPSEGAEEQGEVPVPRWLKDEHGTQVTDDIKTQEIEDQATWRERRRRLRELLIKRDEGLPSEEEDGADDEAGG